jgi:nicotinamidase-related amidase
MRLARSSANTALLMIDHQTGLMHFLPSVEPGKLRLNILALGEVGKRFALPAIIASSWHAGQNGPTVPAFAAMFPDQEPIERDTIDV